MVDNLSPFTHDILDCMIELDEKYIYKKYSEVGNIYENSILYDKVILSGRRKNSNEINIVMADHFQGTITVNILRPNSLIPDKTSVNVYENHRYSVAKLPEDFISLGCSNVCKYEVFSHIKKRIFGTQFHPEKSDGDGFALLSKFLQL